MGGLARVRSGIRRRLGGPTPNAAAPLTAPVMDDRLSEGAASEAGAMDAPDDIPWDTFVLPSSDAPGLLVDAANDLERTFFGNSGRPVHKWLHYLPVYNAHFSRFRDTEFRMLEIGVWKGGSLDMWRRYFGASATIVGIDVNPECAQVVDSPNVVRIGSQDDPDFLRALDAEFGPFDLILDDGSHHGRHQRASFDVLFPLLAEGGIYVIEDLHTSYWRDLYDGGYRRPGTAIEFLKDVMDDLHGWYHRHDTSTPARDWISGMHLYDSIVVLDKAAKAPPRNIEVHATDLSG